MLCFCAGGGAAGLVLLARNSPRACGKKSRRINGMGVGGEGWSGSGEANKVWQGMVSGLNSGREEAVSMRFVFRSVRNHAMVHGMHPCAWPLESETLWPFACGPCGRQAHERGGQEAARIALRCRGALCGARPRATTRAGRLALQALLPAPGTRPWWRPTLPSPECVGQGPPPRPRCGRRWRIERWAGRPPDFALGASTPT